MALRVHKCNAELSRPGATASGSYILSHIVVCDEKGAEIGVGDCPIHVHVFRPDGGTP